ncbi:superfamily II DNA/RNA helicase [Streptococcus criceti]|nr:hypothetical protein [Streptococcus criceti]SUN42775.1 superfamily II DNA/RNA helicase [Streptococcus criceti]
MTAVYYEKSTGRQVKQLARFPYYKSDEQLNLLEYQDNKERFLINDNQLQADFALQYSQFTTRQKLQLYFSLFKGRRDVYAKSYINQEKRGIFSIILLITTVGAIFLLKKGPMLL